MFGDKFMRDVSDDKKLVTLLFLTHLDAGLRRAYARIKRKLSKCEPDEFAASKQQNGAAADWTGWLECKPKWRIYKHLTCLLHIINGLKYTLVLLTLDGALIRTEVNCYVFGRVFAHQEMSKYLIVLMHSWTLFILAWRCTLRGSHFEMDYLVFLLHDQESIEEELKQIEALNANATEAKLFPHNCLQKVLFYKFNSISYRLRPNRTGKSRENLRVHLNRVVLVLMLATIATVSTVAPIALKAGLADASYIRSYPSCCPQLEQMAREGILDSDQMSFNLCETKLATIFFDVFDSLLVYLDFYVTVALPICVTSIIAWDLGQYWRIIDCKAAQLLKWFRYRECSEFSNKFPAGGQADRKVMFDSGQRILVQKNPRQSGSSPNETTSPATDELVHIHELQSLLVDFFDSVGRADKSVNIMLTFSALTYAVAIMLFGFFSWKVDQLHRLTIIRALFVIMITLFIGASSVSLQLKRIIDRSYVNLCSIMAHDKSRSKHRWIIILESYTFNARDSFTVFKNVRFTWLFVLNLVASSMSFLLAIATLKERRDT